MGRPRQQSDQASGGILTKSHVRWLGESEQQPRLSQGASGLDPQKPEFPMAFQCSWFFWITVVYLSMNVEIMLFGSDDSAPCLAFCSGLSLPGISTRLGTPCKAPVQPCEINSAILVRHCIVLRKSVGVLLLKAKIAVWESMKKTCRS
ncbi:hypothetical protein TNCV_621441 [Trichonephila clavipes]|nr:hypothetical protein TNCV_621441 [Trichonephila clavipes]